jgi:polar amino acid transport system permease protein
VAEPTDAAQGGVAPADPGWLGTPGTRNDAGPPVMPDASDDKVVPLRHPGRWASAVIVAVVAAMMIHTLFFSYTVRNGQREPRFEWGVVRQYIFTSPILHGVLVTLEITVLAMIVGIILGVVFAVMRLSPNPVVSGASWLYIWFFRGTPVLVQILFWYYIAYLYPSISFGIPFGPSWGSLSLVNVPGIGVGVLALGLNEGAYMAEIVRAGIISVDHGQTEAAQSIGMTRLKTMRRIVLPQAMRLIVPVTGNETISMLKTSSLVSVVAINDLLQESQNIYARTYQTIPLLMVASLWYLAITTVLTIGQYFIERHYARGSSSSRPRGFFEILLSNLVLRRRVRYFGVAAELEPPLGDGDVAVLPGTAHRGH